MASPRGPVLPAAVRGPLIAALSGPRGGLPGAPRGAPLPVGAPRGAPVPVGAAPRGPPPPGTILPRGPPPPGAPRGPPPPAPGTVMPRGPPVVASPVSPVRPPLPASSGPPPVLPMFTDQETLNRQFELFEQSHQAIRDFFLREDQLLGEERRKFEEWKQAQQAWLEQQNQELAGRQAETMQFEGELQQMERDVQARERQVQKQQQTFQQNQRQLQLAQQQHAQQLQQNQQLIKQQQDQLAATQHNQAQQQAQLQQQEQQQMLTEQQLEQQRQQQAALREQLAGQAAAYQQQAQSLQAQAQAAQAQALHQRSSQQLISGPGMLPGGGPMGMMGGPGVGGPPALPAPGPVTTYVQDREEPKAIALRQTVPPGYPWHDPDFPPDVRSLFINGQPPGTEFGRAAYSAQWRRAAEVWPGAVLFKGQDGGPSGADIIQGAVGDMWFLNALSIVATNSRMILNLVVSQFPDIGMYEFRFWKGGKWVTSVVDDYLPFLPTGDGLLMSHCSDPSELWVALLEKAYAKLHGSYQSLNGGNTEYALVDLTGGVTEHIGMNTENGRAVMRCGGIQEKLQQARSEGWLVGCVFKHEAGAGLLPGRSYALIEMTDAAVHLRNPWGVRGGVDGPGADGTTFWVSIPELEQSIAALQICRTYNYNYGEPWYMSADLDGYWGGQNAGGQVSMSNPQYVISSPEDCTCFVALFQYDVPYQRQDRDVQLQPSYRKPHFPDPNPNLCCGSFVLQCDSHSRMHNPSGSVLTKDIIKYATFVYGRQAGTEFRIAPGRSVCIMPCQFTAGTEAPYQLYVFSTRPFVMRKTLGEGMEQTMPGFSIGQSAPPPGIAWDPGFRSRVVVERQLKGQVLEEDDEMR